MRAGLRLDDRTSKREEREVRNKATKRGRGEPRAAPPLKILEGGRFGVYPGLYLVL